MASNYLKIAKNSLKLCHLKENFGLERAYFFLDFGDSLFIPPWRIRPEYLPLKDPIFLGGDPGLPKKDIAFSIEKHA